MLTSTPVQRNHVAGLSHFARIATKLWRLRLSFVIAIVYFVVAAAAFNGFYTKWHLCEGQKRNGIEVMLDGTAYRPFVFRQLLPYSANLLERAIPGSLKPKIEARILAGWSKGAPTLAPKYAIRYYIVYYLGFLSLFCSLLLMRTLCLRVGIDGIGSTLAPLALALFTPYYLSAGGYYYDFPELLFLSAAAYCAICGRLWLLFPLTVLATLNKESFFFFLPTLFPVMKNRLGWQKAAALVALLIVISGGTHYLAEQPYMGNAGGAVEVHLRENVRFYSDIRSLFVRSTNYGIFFNFDGYSAVTLLLLSIVFLDGREILTGGTRMHALLAVAINLPLFVIFCAPGEMRNLSMLSITVLLLTAKSLSVWSSRIHSFTVGDERHASSLVV